MSRDSMKRKGSTQVKNLKEYDAYCYYTHAHTHTPGKCPQKGTGHKKESPPRCCPVKKHHCRQGSQLATTLPTLNLSKSYYLHSFINQHTVSEYNDWPSTGQSKPPLTHIKPYVRPFGVKETRKQFRASEDWKWIVLYVQHECRVQIKNTS